MKRIIAPLAAIILGLSALVATPPQAEAGRGGRIAFGIAAGIIGGALLYDHYRYRPRYYGGYYHRPYYAYHRPYYASYGPYYRPYRSYRVRYYRPRHHRRHWRW